MTQRGRPQGAVRPRGRLAVAAVAFTVLATLLPGAAAAKEPPGRLSKQDRQTLAAAEVSGRDTVRVLIATKDGQGDAVAKAIRDLGGTIEYREDAVNYLRASVPTDKAQAASALGTVEGLELDRTIPLPDVRVTPDGIAPIVPTAPPGASTPKANPYMPIQDTGVATWLIDHPTWDGRGITIGIVDAGISLDHPSLTVTSTGERKIVDWVTGTDPLTDPDPTWLDMRTAARVVTATGGTFTWTGTTGAGVYTAPADGTYRFTLFNERDTRLGGEVGSDVNRDGNPAGSSGLFGVLWNQTTNDVWVDTDQDRSFADQTPMTDYRVRFDVGYFGTDNPATAVAERMPFTIQTDPENTFVNIGIVSSFHGSHVAGIAAGNALFGGAMSGAAPGAKIVSLRACLFVTGCTNHALLEGMIWVARDAGVDVINMSIGGLPALNDGNNMRCHVYADLIETYGVQMFLSAGNNGPGVNTAGDPGLCDQVMGMGAYLSRQTMQFGYGVDVPYTDNLNYFTSRGPREDGRLAPIAIAPGAAVSTAPLWQAGVGLPYTLPPGYQFANGTSMASPQSAGLGASLLSAATATGVEHSPAQIRQSLISTARYLTEGGRYQPFDQGNGLLDIQKAWALLQQEPTTMFITSEADVNTILAGFLDTPGRGPGIYDREGVTINQPYTRTITFARRDQGGSTGTVKRFALSLVGNDGTFSLGASHLSIKKNGSSDLTVRINPTAYGVHSTIINLDDPNEPGIEYQTTATVIVAQDLTGANGFSASVQGTIDRAQQQHFFFEVPAGAPAFKVDMVTPANATAGTGQIRFLRWNPQGQPADDNAVSNCYTPPAAAGCAGGQSPLSRTVINPMAGVWEVSVDARRTSDADDVPFTISASILGASVTPNPDVIASATLGTPIARSYTLTNLFGAFTGRAVGTTLGSARMATPTIAHGAQAQFPVTVAAGSTSLRATIGGPSDPSADLDLFVFNCTTGTCVQAGVNADGDSEESVTINNPAAGLWIVLVDGFDVPAGTTTYNYIDVFVNPANGSIVVTDANALRAAGSSWTVPAVVTANVIPAAGRVLYGNVEVRTDANVLIGRGDVIIQSVS
jgi:hypothetical protein